MNIYQKLIEVRKKVTYLQKENSGAQYKYVSSSQVLTAVREMMDEMGLILEPAVIGHKVTESVVEGIDKDTKHVIKKTTTYFTELDMTMTWVNADNPEERIEKLWYCQGVDIAGEKGVGKALTYGEKYFLLKFLNIATDKDDPDASQHDKQQDQVTTQSQGTQNGKGANKNNNDIRAKKVRALYDAAKNLDPTYDIKIILEHATAMFKRTIQNIDELNNNEVDTMTVKYNKRLDEKKASTA